jgi:hypothetical protein
MPAAATAASELVETAAIRFKNAGKMRLLCALTAREIPGFQKVLDKDFLNRNIRLLR